MFVLLEVIIIPALLVLTSNNLTTLNAHVFLFNYVAFFQIVYHLRFESLKAALSVSYSLYQAHEPSVITEGLGSYLCDLLLSRASG